MHRQILGFAVHRVCIRCMQNPGMHDLRSEIAASAARLVVEDGLDYAAAKRRAARESGVLSSAVLPDNREIEAAVRTYLNLFHGQTQARELAALRRLALTWMDRLIEFRPHLCGAVWHGTATRNSGIHLDLFCDDPKLTEIAVVNLGLALGSSRQIINRENNVSTVHFIDICSELDSDIDIFMSIKDYDMIRGELRSDRQGRSPRGDAAQLRRLVEAAADA